MMRLVCGNRDSDDRTTKRENTLQDVHFRYQWALEAPFIVLRKREHRPGSYHGTEVA